MGYRVLGPMVAELGVYARTFFFHDFSFGVAMWGWGLHLGYTVL